MNAFFINIKIFSFKVNGLHTINQNANMELTIHMCVCFYCKRMMHRVNNIAMQHLNRPPPPTKARLPHILFRNTFNIPGVQWVIFCVLFCSQSYVIYIFLLNIVLSIPLRFTAFYFPLFIFKRFLLQIFTTSMGTTIQLTVADYVVFYLGNKLCRKFYRKKINDLKDGNK